MPYRPFADFSILALVAGVIALAPPAAAQDARDSANIAAGRQLYHGRGQCALCHGERGEGTDEGPSLTAGPWTLGNGSFAWLLDMTRHAGWGARRRDDDPRPMRGPTMLDSTEVRRVASYVFSISRAKPPAPKKKVR